MEDFEYGLGENVVIGTQSAVVTGRAEYAFEDDGYQLLIIDEYGLPFKDWFDAHLISKGRPQ